MWGTVIIVIALIIVAIFAIRSSRKHFAGEGDCCGGGGDKEELIKKTLDGKVIEKKLIKIDGMSCDNCRRTVENGLNEIDGVLAEVNLRKKQAVVSLDRDVPDDVLKRKVESLDYTVKSIEPLTA